jgi:hypothetical protein
LLDSGEEGIAGLEQNSDASDASIFADFNHPIFVRRYKPKGIAKHDHLTVLGAAEC